VQLLLGATFQPYGEIAVMRADGSDVHLLTDISTEKERRYGCRRAARGTGGANYFGGSGSQS
jgi:hypothetical protein